MPVRPCNSDGKPGYRWGHRGKCYTYTSGDDASRKRAHEKAAKQGRAIHAVAQRLLEKLKGIVNGK